MACLPWGVVLEELAQTAPCLKQMLPGIRLCCTEIERNLRMRPTFQVVQEHDFTLNGRQFPERAEKARA
jgi:hypothetical protein